jgi:hypothetical protein
MITALIISLVMFSGGGSASWPIKEVRQQIEVVVPDETRAKAAKAATREIANALDDFNGQYADSAKALQKVHQQYDADALDYATAFIPLLGNRRTMNQRLIDGRTQLVGAMTKDEWEQIFTMERLDAEED